MVRFKNRYILMEIEWFPDENEPQDRQQQPRRAGLDDRGMAFQSELLRTITRGFGHFGRGAVKRSLGVKYWNAATGSAVVRCPRDWHTLVLLALTMLTSVDGTRVAVRVLHVGGSLKSCGKAALRFGRSELAAAAAFVGEDSDGDEAMPQRATTPPAAMMQ
jgi:ribonuclease P/MRP protein subunit POP5